MPSIKVFLGLNIAMSNALNPTVGKTERVPYLTRERPSGPGA